MDTTIPWNRDTTYALGLYRTLGLSLGIWPLKTSQKIIESNIRVAFVTITQLSMSISLLVQLLVKGNCGAITDIVDVLSLITCGFLTMMKVIVPRIYQSNMRIIVNSAIEDWLRIDSEKSRKVMMFYAYTGRLVFIVQMTGAYAAGFPLIFARLPFIAALWTDQTNYTTTHYDVPIGPSCWMPSDISTFNYVIYYSVQSVQLFVVCTGYIGGDILFFGWGMHMCGQLELLYVSLEGLYGTGDSVKQKDNLSQFVARHKHMLLLANHFEVTYNTIILAQVVADTLLTCISGIVLLIVLPSGDFIIIIGLIIRIYLVYVQLFMYSYVGEQLSAKIKKLQVAIYCIPPWYKMRPCIVRDMAFIIMRSNYEFHLTAGKMYNMNLENYKNIVKAMGSYFSILRLMFITENING